MFARTPHSLTLAPCTVFTTESATVSATASATVFATASCVGVSSSSSAIMAGNCTREVDAGHAGVCRGECACLAVCCSVLQCVAVCCSVLQCECAYVVVRYSVSQPGMLVCVAVNAPGCGCMWVRVCVYEKVIAGFIFRNDKREREREKERGTAEE